MSAPLPAEEVAKLASRLLFYSAPDLDGGGPGAQAQWEAHVRIQNV